MTFSKLAKALSSNFKVYSIDLPGFGQSSIGVPLGIEEIADILYKFIEKFQIERPIICGHSYGGRIGIVYASKYPVDKLVLISSAGLKQKLKISKKLKIRIYKMLKKCHLPVKMGSTDYRNADNVKRIMLVKAVNKDLTEYMYKITAPTLLIYGEKDDVTPVVMANQIKERIKGASLIVMEECGHFPYLERASFFTIILMSFLLGEDYAL